ncbi:MAG: peptide deformylase [Lachnospiraceae bacterium]|nr:peptide deformylase [Lachnospiraceae bacterium]
MAIRKVREDGDDVLRKVCKPVEKLTDRLQTLIDDMFDTMYEANGVGLAAPQVGILKRIVVIDIDDGDAYTLINPHIVSMDGEQIGDEGCLSLPGLVGTVARPEHVVCEAYDRNMEKYTIDAHGLLARAICHELDHLDGILYKDLAVDGLRRVEREEIDEEDEE